MTVIVAGLDWPLPTVAPLLLRPLPLLKLLPGFMAAHSFTPARDGWCSSAVVVHERTAVVVHTDDLQEVVEVECGVDQHDGHLPGAVVHPHCGLCAVRCTEVRSSL